MGIIFLVLGDFGTAGMVRGCYEEEWEDGAGEWARRDTKDVLGQEIAWRKLGAECRRLDRKEKSKGGRSHCISRNQGKSACRFRKRSNTFTNPLVYPFVTPVTTPLVITPPADRGPRLLEAEDSQLAASTQIDLQILLVTQYLKLFSYLVLCSKHSQIFKRYNSTVQKSIIIFKVNSPCRGCVGAMLWRCLYTPEQQ